MIKPIVAVKTTNFVPKQMLLTGLCCFYIIKVLQQDKKKPRAFIGSGLYYLVFNT